MRLPTGLSRVAALHAFLASAFFAPFFFTGRVLMPSGDWLDMEFPLLMLARQNLRAGHWGLWNPFVLCGSPVTSSALFHVLYPETWLLLAVPDRFFFVAVTALFYVKIVLLGIFGFLLFREESGEDRWSLVASIVYALGGFAIWTVMTNATSLTLWFTVALWVAWSHARRGSMRNYLYFALSFAMMGACANLLEERYAVGIVVALGAWRMRRASLPLVGGAATALFLTAPRWLPSTAELLVSNRIAIGSVPGFAELGVLGARLFDPEIFGVSYLSSFHLLRSLSTALSHSYVHIHTHMPHYFGVLPLLMVTSMLFAKGVRFWKILFLVSLALVLKIEPISTFAQFSMNFLYHPRCLHMLLPLTFCMLLARWNGEISGRVRWVLGVAALYLTVIWLLYLQYRFDVRLVLLLSAAAVTLFVRFYRPWLATLAIVGVTAVGWALAAESPFAPLIVVSVVTISLAGVSGLERSRTILVVTGAALLSVLWTPASPTKMDLPAMSVLFGLGLLGAARLAAASLVFFGRGVVFPLCLVITAVDVVAAARVHGNMVLNTYLVEKNPYPPLTKAIPDFTLHRATLPNLLVASPTYHRVHADQEDLSSFYSVYGVPSYGGYVSSVTPAYTAFLETLVPRKELWTEYPILNGFIANFKNRRFLELVGVGEKSVARFAMYKHWEITANPYARLKAADFAPLEDILLERAPGLPATAHAATPLPPIVHSSDEIEIAVGDAAPGVLLFNDSFHRGWSAVIDGEPAAIQHANVNFMAVAVPKGAKRVTFTFEPPFWALSLRLALLGVCLLLIPFAAKIRWGVRSPRALPSRP